MKKVTETPVSINLRNNSFSYAHTITTDPNNNQHKTYTLDCYEVYYLISGSVTYHVEGMEHELTPGDLLIINNKEVHRPYFTSDESYERVLIFFSPEFCSHYCNDEYKLLKYFENRKPGSFNRIPKELLQKENVAYYFESIEELIKSNLPENKILIEITFIELLIKINAIIMENIRDLFNVEFDSNEKVEQTINYINNNLYRQLTLNEIEEKFYINKYYFSHLFKKVTGFSFKEYLTNKRVAKAAELIKLSIPASEASVKVGFNDYSNFYKAFKRITGVAPSKYK